MIRTTIGKADLTALVLILSVAVVIAYGYFTRVAKPNFEPRLELHSQIIKGTAPSPYRYRILVPVIAEALRGALGIAMPTKAAFLLAYAIYDLIAISSLLVLLFYWLRTWFNSAQALVGVLFVAATMPVALQDHYFQPWSLLEAALFTAALLVIHGRRYLLLSIIVAVAALNRETAILIPIAFLATLDVKGLLSSGPARDLRPILLFGGLCAIWAVGFFGLRELRGPAAGVEPVHDLFARNITRANLLLAFRNGGMFLGGFWVFAALGLRCAPAFIRRSVLLIPLYVAAISVWGVWYEVRLLMPLYPLLIPLGLSFLYLRRRSTWAA